MMKPQSNKMQNKTWRDQYHQDSISKFVENDETTKQENAKEHMKRPEPSKQHKQICWNQNNVKRTNEERNKPDADLENVACELSLNGRFTNLTTKLPNLWTRPYTAWLFGVSNHTRTIFFSFWRISFWEDRWVNRKHMLAAAYHNPL